jgi:anti-sigma regulatory factor (Ser/Thr protein kinase)
VKAPRSELRVELPATLEAIESFCVQFQHWRGVACAGLDSFSSELLLREALTNSVLHGASEDPRERISCVLRVKRGRLIIAVRGGGKGFDWRAAWDRQAGAEEPHGRGIEILRHYAKSVRFNPSGNSVTLIQRF